DGVLRIVATEGDTLPIGAVIASIGANGGAPEPEEAQPAAPPSAADAAPAEEAPDAAPAEEARPAPARSPVAEAPPTAEPSPAAPPPEGDGGERVKASPVARRIARD